MKSPEMSDTLEHVLLNHHVGPIMIICQIKKRYISISRTLCSCTWENRGGEHHLVKLGCSVQCDLGTERIWMEFIRRWDSRVRGEDCWKWAIHHLRWTSFWGDFSHCLSLPYIVKYQSDLTAKWCNSSRLASEEEDDTETTFILSLRYCMTIKV